MKFDFAIGNPPYQDNTIGDNKGFAPPVYNLFMEAAYSVADKVEIFGDNITIKEVSVLNNCNSYKIFNME